MKSNDGKTTSAHDVRPVLSPALVGLPTFPERLPARTLSDCQFFDVNAAAVLAIKAYYDAVERLPLLADEMGGDCRLDAYDFACEFIDRFTLRLSSLCWSSGLPCDVRHVGLELQWPSRADTVHEWRETAPGFLAEIMKCLPVRGNASKSRRTGAR